jgi:RNA polymerase sigma factor (sigma-70 family)
MRTIKIDEKALVLGLKARKDSEFKILYQNYAKSLKNNISRYISDIDERENVLQDTFIKIWLNIDKYDSSKGALYTWILNVGNNTAIDFVRRKANKIRTQDVGLEVLIDYPVADNNSEYIGFNQIINQLEPKQKQVIDLHYFMGYTHQQTAEYLNIPEGTVKTRLKNAIKQLKIYFKTEFNHEITN